MSKIEVLYTPEKRNLLLREKIESKLLVNRTAGEVAAYDYLSTPRKVRTTNTNNNINLLYLIILMVSITITLI